LNKKIFRPSGYVEILKNPRRIDMALTDTGKELFYSAHDKKAHGVALAYAALKWGKNITQEQGKILFHRELEVDRKHERGWSR